MAKIVQASVKLDISDAEAKVKQLGSSLARALARGLTAIDGGEFANLARSLRKLEKITDDVTGANRKLKQSQAQLERASRERERALARERREVARAELAELRLAQARQESSRSTGFGANLANNVGRFIQFRLADAVVEQLFNIAGAFRDTIASAIEFESQFTNVLKTVDDATSRLPDGTRAINEIGIALRESLLELSRDIPIAIGEIARIAEIAGQLGVPSGEIDEFTSVIAQLSVTTSLTAEQAAISLARFSNIVGLSITDLEAFASAIVDLGNNFATTESEITTFVQRIAGVRSVSRLSAEELSADLAGIATAFSAVGQGSTASSTAIQKVFLTIAQAINEGGEALDIFAETAGVASDTFATIFQQDSTEAFVLFIEGLGRAGDQAFKILSDLELADARLIRSFLNVANAGSLLRDAVELSNDALEDNVALTDEAGLRFQTTESRIQNLKNSFKELGIVIADDVSVIGDFADALAEINNKAVDLINTRREIERLRSELDIGDQDGFQIQNPFQREGPFINQGQQFDFINPNIGDANLTVQQLEDIARSVRLVRDSLDQIEIPDLFEENLTLEGAQTAEVQKLNAELDTLQAVAYLTSQGMDVTAESVKNFALRAVLAEQTVAEFIETLERQQVLSRLSEEFDITAQQAELLIEQISRANIGFNELPVAMQLILAQLPEFSQKALELDEALAEDVEQLQNLDRELRSTSEANGRLTVEFLRSIGLSEELAEKLLGIIDPTSEFGLQAEETAQKIKRMEENMQGLVELTAELVTSLLATGDANNDLAISFIEQAVAIGATQDEIINLAIATGTLTQEEIQLIQSTTELQEVQNLLVEEVLAGNITWEEAGIQLRQVAQSMNLATISSAELAEITSELVVSFLDTNDATEALVASLIEYADNAGATSDQIIELAEATGVLSQEELNTVINTIKLRQEQARLFDLVRQGQLTFTQATLAVVQYAQSLNLANQASIGLADTSSTFASSLREVGSSLGGASGSARETENSFRDLFVGVVNSISEFEEFGESVTEVTDNWAESLLDVAIEAGASVTQILALASATGLLTEEQTQQLLNLAILERGIEQIADQYVSGAISAEEASAKVKGFSEAVASGEKLDVSEFGISLSDLSTRATQTASAVGGAGQATENFLQQLVDSSEEAGATAEQLLNTAQAVGEYSDAQIKAGLVQDTTNRLIETYGKLIAEGFSAETAVSQIESIRSALDDLSSQQIAELIDLGVEFNLTPEELLDSIRRLLDGEELTVPASIDATIEAREIDAPEQIRLEADVKVRDVEVPQTVEIQGQINISEGITGLREDAGVVLNADGSPIDEAIDDATGDTRTVPIDADVSQMLDEINTVTTDATYITQIDADVSAVEEAIEGLTDRIEIDIVANVTTNVDEGEGVTSSTGAGNDNVIARDGGLLLGPSHVQGGVLVEAEGGEFIVNNRAVTPFTEPILRSINEGRFSDQVISSLADLESGLLLRNTMPEININLPSDVVNQTGLTPNNTSIDQSSSIDQRQIVTNETNITNIVQQNANRRVFSVNDIGRF